MAVWYEWDYEQFEADEIIDHDHADKLTQFNRPLEPDERLVLVRDDDHNYRGWAYVENGELPERFDNGFKVPKRFHKELAKAGVSQ